MADARAFVSFDFDNNQTEKMLFCGQAKNSRTPFSIHDWSAKAAMPQREWKAIVEEKIKKTNMLIVLVGKNMATATGVKVEIEMAHNHSVPVFGIYVGGSNTSSTLPEGLPRNRTIAWEWSGIASAIDQVMAEGKNRR